MAALHAAVALMQVHHVAMRICQYLHLRIVCQYCGQECYSLACMDASPNIIRQCVQGKATSTWRGSSTNRSANMEPSLQTPARGSVVTRIMLQHILTDGDHILIVFCSQCRMGRMLRSPKCSQCLIAGTLELGLQLIHCISRNVSIVMLCA